MADEQISWRFYGYVTPAGGREVQEWFDSLSEDERDEARDAIGYLQVQPRQLWNKPEFEAFDADISEVRFKAALAKKAYRIYGAFWPEKQRYVYTFLLGKNKKVDNDQHGKREALRRLRKLRSKEASIHEFKFKAESNKPPAPGQGGTAPIC